MRKRTSEDPICQRVDSLLDDAGISRVELARAIGIIPSTLNMQLKQGHLHASVIAPIADHLGVSTSYLLTGDDDWMSLSARGFDETQAKLDEVSEQLERCRALYVDSATF